MPPARYSALPEIVSGAPLNHFVGVIVPLARTNMLINPSIETNANNWNASGASIARSATKQYHGTYSLAITPTSATTDGAFHSSISLTSGTMYVFSCKFWGLPGVKYKISFATTGGVDLAVRAFVGTGRWQWQWVFYNETASLSRRLYVTKNGSTSTGVFYVDGAQVESCADGILQPTTYIDGDQQGLLVGQQPPPYGWTGTPHASTSYRTALTRAGGYVVDIKTAYGFLLTALIGLGMATPNNVSIPYTVLDGARYQRTTKPPRTFSLTGRFQASTPQQLNRVRSDMRSALDRDLVPLQQPLTLMIEPRDECGPTGDFTTVPCIYAGGLEGNDTSALAEDAAPTFTMYVPFLGGGDAGASLTVQTSTSNTRGILKRNPDGTWAAVGTGVTTGNPVYAILVARDGKIYAGGGFTQMGGVANTNKIAYFDPADSAWHAMGTGAGASGDVWALAEGPDGTIYAGGDFSAMGGVANTKCIAKWSSGAWTAMGTGGGASTTQVRALQFNNIGTFLYVGGNFTDIGGSGADYLATWSGSAWAVVGSATALNGNVYALARRLGSTTGMYVGGAFTNASAIANADYVAAWSGSAYSALSTGMDSDVNTLIVRPNGALVAGGAFTTAGGIAVTYNAIWNGANWAAFGPGLNALTNAIGRGFGQTLYYGGAFSVAGSPTMTLNDGLATWLGNAFAFPDVDLGGAATVYAITQAGDGTLYLGSDGTSPAIAAGITAVTNSAPGYVYPRLVITGPSSGSSRIYQIINYTTGYGVWLNYTINAGEQAIFDFDPQHLSFRTTAPGYDDNGNLAHTIIPGSQPSLMYLAPGSNSISFFAASSTVTATLSWQTRYNGIADLVQ